MDSPSPGIITEVRFKKHKGLHDSDNRFVQEVIKVVTSLDGSSTMQFKIHSKFPTRFILTLMEPPIMTLDDMHQIFLMNGKIISIKVDLEQKELKIEAYKHNEKTKKKRKRVAYDEFDVPSGYDLSMVDKNDKKHINGILRNILGMTTMEFTSRIYSRASYYDLEIEDVETLNVAYIQEVVSKYRAFITHTTFDYPQKKFKMQIRRNDTPITTISHRKKLKVR